jgi:hypothetical protein
VARGKKSKRRIAREGAEINGAGAVPGATGETPEPVAAEAELFDVSDSVAEETARP